PQLRAPRSVLSTPSSRRSTSWAASLASWISFLSTTCLASSPLTSYMLRFRVQPKRTYRHKFGSSAGNPFAGHHPIVSALIPAILQYSFPSLQIWRGRPCFGEYSRQMPLRKGMSEMSENHALRRSSPESQGLPSAAVCQLLDYFQDKNLEVHSIMILRHGNVVAEGWWDPY